MSKAKSNPASDAGPTRPKRWGRRVRLTLIWIVGAALAFRLLLLILLPTVIARAARYVGVDCSYHRLQLSLLGTNAALWDVVIKTKDGTQELLKTDFAYANFSTWELLRLRLDAWRLEADGVRTELFRKSDGTIPLLDALKTASSTPPPSRRPGVNFAPPLKVRAIRLHRVSAHVRDEAVTPPFDATVLLDASVADLGVPGTPARLSVDLTSNDLFDIANASGEATAQADSFDAAVDFSLRGLHADRAATYLAALGIKADQRNIDVSGKSSLSLQSVPGVPGVATGSVLLSNLALRAGSEPVATLGSAAIKIAALSPSSLHASEVTVKDGRLHAIRSADGTLTFASFSRAIAAAAVASPPTAAPQPAAGFSWQIDSFTASGFEASLLDQAVLPANTLSVSLGSFEAQGLRSDGPPESKATFAAILSAPRLAGRIDARGDALPFAPSPSANLALKLDGIRPEALVPYLRPLGIEPTLDAGALRCTLHAAIDTKGPSPRLALTLDGLDLRDGEQTLVELGRVAVSGLSIDPATSGLTIESLEGTGPTLAAKRSPDRKFAAPGVRYDPAHSEGAANAASPLAATADAGKSAAPHIPPIRIGKVSWSGIHVRFEDQATAGAPPMEITDAGIEATGIAFDPRPEATAGTPGTMRAWVRAPGLAEQIDVNGTLTPGPASLAIDLALNASGLNTRAGAPYASPLGIEPTLEHGAFQAKIRASLAQADGTVRVEGSVSDLSLRDGERPLATVKNASAGPVVFGEAVSVGPLRLTGVDIDLARDRQGAIIAAGIRVPQLPTHSGPWHEPLEAIASLGQISFQGATVEDVRIGWSDDAVSPPVRFKTAIDATLGPLMLNAPSPPPTPFMLRLAADGLAERVETTGTLSVGGTGLSLTAKVDGSGIRATGVKGYLPSTMDPALERGQFKTQLSMTLRRAEAGGDAFTLAIDGMDFREAGSEFPLAAAGPIAIDVERFDPAGGEIHVRRLAADGLGARAERRSDGSIALLGVALKSSEGPDAAAPPPTAPNAQPATSPTAALAATHQRLPLIVVDALDIGVDRLTFVDGMRPKAAPVSLTSTKIQMVNSARLLGDKPEENPPIEVRVEGSVESFVGRFTIAGKAAPFAQVPTLSGTLEASGIDGAGLEQAIPEIAAFVDAAPLKDGRLRGAIEAEAKVHRRGPLEIDFARGIDATFTLTDAALTLGQDGSVLGGIDKVYAEQVRLEPATGNITAKLAEVTGITANVWRDQAGIHAMGVVLKIPKLGAAHEQPPPPPPAPEPPQPTKAGATESADLGPEFRIERLTVSGLNFHFEDRVVTPPIVVPITSLDAEIRGLSSQLFQRERPVRFNVSALGGKVSLPKPVRGGTITGALGDIGKKAEDVAPEMEDRDFFSQAVASGSMSFYPVPRGRMVASISSLELLAIRGLAQEMGTSVGGGVFDGRVEINAQGNGVGVRSKLVLTDLRYSEPPEGPVARFISLPVPLDVAIKAVEAPDGSITLPLEMTLDQQGITTGKIIGAAAGAAGQVLATAVVSAPVKVVTGFAGLLGDTKGNTHWVEEPAIELGYTAGVAFLDAKSEQRLVEVLRRARSDKKVQVAIEHELGSADAELAAQRANPPPETAKALAEDLRRRRALLLSRRAAIVTRAPADALGEHAPTSDLRSINEALADTEDAFDELFDLLRPGADRLAARRGRAAAIEMGDARLGQVRDLITAVAGPAGAARIAVSTPRSTQSDTTDSRLIVRVRRLEKK